jgi:nucleotide-binding universal stress UspA family protein
VGRPLREVRRILVGVDGSEPARRAVELVAALAAPPGGRVALVSVVEPVRLPSTGLLPERVRGLLLAERAALERERTAAARREAESGARALRRAGWAVDVDVRQGVPLAELLAARAAGQAHVLVLGARGVGGVERLLLGSVADGALTRSPVPVLIVR